MVACYLTLIEVGKRLFYGAASAPTAGVNAPPSSYTVGGKQYIAVAAGGNVQLDFKRGNSIIAFTAD